MSATLRGAGMKRYSGCAPLRPLGLLLGLFVSCGGESRNAPESSELDCSDVREQSKARLDAAAADAAGECSSATDCKLFTATTRCAYGCGFVAATTDEARLQATVDDVNALCRDECVPPAPPCAPRQEVADCLNGKCVVAESNVLDCEAIRHESVRMLSEAASNAAVACDSSSDCHLFTGNPECAYSCGWVVATTDDAPLQSAVDDVNALCRDECRQPEPPCGGFIRQVAECVSGKCVPVEL